MTHLSGCMQASLVGLPAGMGCGGGVVGQQQEMDREVEGVGDG